ncbi:hypothetical protein [Novipirellula artificiosorum]|uniref:Uncharacterized protein n=1 Tax=Novipirellula artificiosorum TaxID=2528016 RepID=A0A5C6DSD6_9BACT|nr:hypothetical protein [Novipirellula artificiosorum]TWU38401.1 hypothetical protein Poly41_28770 [Novipirellula artificiosorum]
MPESKFRVISISTKADRQQRELDRLTGVAAPRTVDVSLKQLVPLLMDAARSKRTWLQDFADDSVRIDSDLYDVLLAYQHYCRQEAA